MELPGTRAVRSAFAAAAQQGLAEQDYSGVFQWLEQQAAARSAATSPCPHEMLVAAPRARITEAHSVKGST